MDSQSSWVRLRALLVFSLQFHRVYVMSQFSTLLILAIAKLREQSMKRLAPRGEITSSMLHPQRLIDIVMQFNIMRNSLKYRMTWVEEFQH